MDSLWYDLRLAFRSLIRRPGFTAVATLTLALGIGATTGVFSAVHAVILASMPFPQPERLTFAIATFEGRTTGFSGPDCLDYIDQSTSFAALGAHLQYAFPMPWTGGERPENVPVTYVSSGLLTALAVAPALGRSFSAEETVAAPPQGPDQPDAPPLAALVSHRFWQTRLGGRPDVIGSSMTLGGSPVPIVGVMPEGFRFLADADVWLPMRLNGFAAGQRRFHNWLMVGRLNPGVTLAQARAELDAIAGRLEQQYPESNRGMGVRLTGLHETLIDRVRPALLLVMGAVALMLLIACGNVASLTLARAVTRRGELAVRVAMGASRGRLVRQLVAESVLVSLLGGALGLALAAALQRMLPALLQLGGNRLPLSAFHLDPVVLGFALAVSLLTGIGVGLGPALRSAALAPSDELKSTRTMTSRGGARVRLALVGVQVALSLVLLLGSTLLVRSFARLMGVGLGFDPERLLTSSLALPSSVSNEEAIEFYSGLLQELRTVPGVTAAAVVSRLPIAQAGGSTQIWTPEHPELRAFSRQALTRAVLPGYFAAVGMPLLAGRDVDERDTEASQLAAVITQAAARMLFDGENPVGRTVLLDTGADEPAAFQVVGLVADARIERLDQEPRPALYVPYAQSPRAGMRLVIRTTDDGPRVVGALRELVSRRRSDVPIQEPATMASVIRASTTAQRSLTAIVASFAASALLLAAIGLFGVLAYQVDQRRHEIGLRMALGAFRGRVLATVLRQGMIATGIGLAAGAVAALLATRIMASQLYEVAPHDPASLVVALASLLAVAVLACLIPALRALRVQPMVALRHE